jgi:endonuclease/exonuclease/phosphatase family metal-dependent hydrolase
MSNQNTLRMMTYNVGGGRKDFGSKPTEVLETIAELSPDILAIQECVDWIDVNGILHNFSELTARTGDFGSNYYFGRTLSLQENMQVKKAIMLDALYHDAIDWAQGNALFARQGFSRLGDPSNPGIPRNVPVFMPPVYEGTRDTDPRYAILSRIMQEPYFPFVINVHLTTLLGERGGEIREIPGKSEEAQLLRLRQVNRLMDLVRPIMNPDNIIILMGDFNAVAKEMSISTVLEEEGDFHRLVPSNNISTHPKSPEAVDHIFIYPKDRILDYSCWIEDTEVTRKASDHLPVLADVILR